MSMTVDEDIDAPHNVVTQPNGVVIIEKLDTPAIRRERNMRRKAEKRKLLQEQGGEQDPGMEGVEGPDANISAGSSEPSSRPHPPADAGPSEKPTSSASKAVPAQDNVPLPQDVGYADFESELSDLSDSEEDESEQKAEEPDDETEDEAVDDSNESWTNEGTQKSKGKPRDRSTRQTAATSQSASGSKKKKPPANIAKAAVASTSGLTALPNTRSNKSKGNAHGMPKKRMFQDDLFVDSTLGW